MNWKYLLIGAAAVATTFALRGQSTLPLEKAREKLKAGALLVDVRTPEEFAEKRLPGAVNVPLNTIKTGITNHATDKTKPVLLHCRTGRRSDMAEKELRSLGYTNVFNLGSFEAAEKATAKAGR